MVAKWGVNREIELWKKKKLWSSISFLLLIEIVKVLREQLFIFANYKIFIVQLNINLKWKTILWLIEIVKVLS